MNLYEFVKRTAAGGTKVLPVHKNNKIPMIDKWTSNASNCPVQIEKWFEGKDINAGILTGSANNLWVLDIDKKNGGLESLEKLEKEFGPIRSKCSFVVRTGGGGLHLYFALTGYQKLPSKIGVLPGIDIKGEGGFVVSPYSVHENGNVYLPIGEVDNGKL